ncbi:MAG TPA: proline racemase family protein [Chiayiivirga sp.]|nr:proline racemase family protein [Chiayiivirga sp.]
MTTFDFIDSHTGGEPTRLVYDGFPSLGEGSLAERRARLAGEFDHLRRAIVCEPRGSEVLVGALLVPPRDPAAVTGVIFFNNVGVLGMCGHGAIGVVRSLQHLGRIGPGEHRLETPVGTVSTTLHEDGHVSIRNVPAYRHARGVELAVPGYGTVRGDVAWGGNWFFITKDTPIALELGHWRALTAFTAALKGALAAHGITGADGAEIDHVEINAASPDGRADARNFVLCPGLAFDRSPCGTGTSAKLACLAADGELAPGTVWRQESLLGSVFEASYAPAADNRILPVITGSAYVTARGQLLFDPSDPLRDGFSP